MSERKHLFLFGHALPGYGHSLIDRIQGCFKHHNNFGSASVSALDRIPTENIRQMVVGPSYVCFLLDNGQIFRLKFDVVEVRSNGAEKSSTGASGSGGGGAGPASTVTNAAAGGPSSSSGATSASANYAAAASRTAKFRRVMMAARRPAFGERAGVIVDRARPVVPASSIPEELISQAQVVLQGKSREVIVRELQRTNLNVNEAVNNLLSRDDDEDEGDDASDAYLPEELLSLLDAGLRTDSSGAALIDADAFYSGSDFDYIVARDLAARRRGEKDKKDKGKDGSAESVQQQFAFGENIQFWTGNEKTLPNNVKKFIAIGSTFTQLFGLADNGHLYAWRWGDQTGQTEAHPRSVQLLPYPTKDEKIEAFTTSAWRVVVQTNYNRMGTFVDDYFGKKMQSCLNYPLQNLPETDAKILSVHACSYLAVARTSEGLYWCGMYPFNERRKNWERARSRTKKHVTFDVSEITVGSEVRTKAHPIYLAGSVAINYSSGTPMVGVLLESGWTLNELCRFRLYTPDQYDQLDVNTLVDTKNAAFNIAVRKRAAPSDEATSSATSGNDTAESNSKPPVKETAWPLNEVTFIHEEKINDTAVVKLIDGAYCAVKYKRSDDAATKEGHAEDFTNLRLMRKDDLVVVSPNKTPRSPECFQRSLTKIPVPEALSGGHFKSMVVDDSGIRVLCEKRNRHHFLRVSILGKLFSDHNLPWYNTALEGSNKNPEVINYGDDFFLMVRDGNGCVLPMLRNAVGGYREPAYLESSNISHFAMGLRYMETSLKSDTILSSSPFVSIPSSNSKTATPKTPNRLGLTAMLITPSSTGSKTEPKVMSAEDPTIMQAVMHADIRAVDQLLTRFGSCKDSALLKREILDARADGNRNILHAAVMNAFATNNKDQADTDSISLTKLVDSNAITKAAEETKKSYEDKWMNMIGAKMPPDQANEISGYISGAIDGTDASKIDPDEAPTPILTNPVGEAKLRQLHSIEILKKLLHHTVMQNYLEELLCLKDIYGYTPFMSAINYRAYTAAAVIFNTLQTIYAGRNSHFTSLTELVFPQGSGTRVDDSPLFMLCYNDTCSFTWTGEEHINQDIFECRTCGLTGSLCCCTECAYTCHRNHDCKLKRTSPTAYCDCWEKCPCKALVSGNGSRREWLWGQLIEKTNLVHRLNGRGEHIMLFLARTVGRQLQEQGAFNSKRSKTRQPPAVPTSDNAPDHDLEPPKFSRFAFAQCLASWKMVKSLLMHGVKTINEYDDHKLADDTFHLGSQHGSSQLDKFAFTFLSKCTEENLDVLLTTLIQELNTKNDERDPEIIKLVSRFVRSVARCFTLVCSSSSNAAAAVYASLSTTSSGTLASSRNQSTTAPPSSSLADAVGRRIGGVTLSGLMQIVRGSSQPSQKEVRKKNITAFVLKCRRVFQTLPTISAIELANCADAVVAPVCLGIVKPTAHVSKSGSSDILDQIEKHLNSEQDLSTAFSNCAKSTEDSTTNSVRAKRRRAGSRRDTERADERENGVAAVEESEEYDSDSDGDGQSSRRLYSQSSATAAEEVANEPAERSRAAAIVDEVVDDSERMSSDSITSVSDDDDDDDDDDDGDDDDAIDVDGEDDSQEGGALVDYEDDGVDDEEDDDGDNPDDDDDEDEAEEQNLQESSGDEDVNAVNESMDVGEPQEPTNGVENDVAASNTDSNVASNEASAGSSEQPNAQQPLEVVVDSEADVSPPPARAERRNMAIRSGTTVRQRHPATRQTPASLLTLASSNEESRDRGARGAATTSSTSEERGSSLAPPSLTWAVRHVDFANSGTSRNLDRIFGSSRRIRPAAEENTGDANRERETDTPPVAAATNANNATSSSRSSKRDQDVELASTANTDAQFGMTFGILVKLVGDLLLQLTNHREFIENKSEIGEYLELKEFEVLDVMMKDVQGRFAHVWAWLERILDRVEAQLRFGNSIMSSSVGHMLKNQPAEERKEEGDKKSKHARSTITVAGRRVEVRRSGASSANANDDLSTSRKDFMTYLLTLMRGHSSENGDELPCIEIATLKPAAFVAEAYLYIHHTFDKLRERIEEHRREADEMDVDVVAPPSADDPNPALETQRRFFRRSNSISFPGMSFNDPHHAFKYQTEQVLPLAVRPYLLHPNVEKMEIFEMAQPLRSHKEHMAKSEEHGNKMPNYQGLGNTPTDCEKLFNGLSELPVVKGARKVKKGENTSAPSAPTTTSSLKVADVLSTADSPMTSAAQKRMDRWYLSLLLIARAFHQDLLAGCGGDLTSSVLLRELSGFAVRDSHFRKQMEKLKGAQTRDLTLEVVRDKHALIVQTIRQLNSQYNRFSTSSSSTTNSASRPALVIGRRIATIHTSSGETSTAPPLAVNKVKVSFRDEPAEGSGVARSFYSAFADAIAHMTHLPAMRSSMAEDHLRAVKARDRASNVLRDSTFRRGGARRMRYALNADAPLYIPYVPSESNQRPTEGSNDGPRPHGAEEMNPTEAVGHDAARAQQTYLEPISTRIYDRVRGLRPVMARKITGMLLALDGAQLANVVNSHEIFRQHVDEAYEVLIASGYRSDPDPASEAHTASSVPPESQPNSTEQPSSSRASSAPNIPVAVAACPAVEVEDNKPLFFQPSKNGFYSPIPGNLSAGRLNAFRNVGRVIGICLQQTEIFPLNLCRHVFKFILGRPINWYDLAFYDPELFNSMRNLIYSDEDDSDQSAEYYDVLALSFSLDDPHEAGELINLKPNGENISVSKENVVEYLYLFVQDRLLGKHVQCLEAIRQGVFDVLPQSSLDALTAEDLRLILCGSQEVSISLMQSFTQWHNESSASAEEQEKIRQWFWSITSKFTHQEKQDLIFFWTGSPTLPSSEESFQPAPTVMLRQTDTQHLPTANTCISRLYLPVYSSKRILRSKLLIAIKTRHFGFI